MGSAACAHFEMLVLCLLKWSSSSLVNHRAGSLQLSWLVVATELTLPSKLTIWCRWSWNKQLDAHVPGQTEHCPLPVDNSMVNKADRLQFELTICCNWFGCLLQLSWEFRPFNLRQDNRAGAVRCCDAVWVGMKPKNLRGGLPKFGTATHKSDVKWMLHAPNIHNFHHETETAYLTSETWPPHTLGKERRHHCSRLKHHCISWFRHQSWCLTTGYPLYMACLHLLKCFWTMDSVHHGHSCRTSVHALDVWEQVMHPWALHSWYQVQMGSWNLWVKVYSFFNPYARNSQTPRLSDLQSSL